MIYLFILLRWRWASCWISESLLRVRVVYFDESVRLEALNTTNILIIHYYSTGEYIELHKLSRLSQWKGPPWD